MPVAEEWLAQSQVSTENFYNFYCMLDTVEPEGDKVKYN